MKNIPAPLLAHLQLGTTTLALCWKIVKRNGDFILGTDHDQLIPIDSGPYAGTYLAQSNITPSDFQNGSDMSVDNVDVVGALSDGTLRIDISSNDIEAGLLDFAACSTFFTNWQAPSEGQATMKTGFFGQVQYDSNYGYKIELRSLSQLLQQNIMQTYADRCNVVTFGDARCKFNVPSVTIPATVSAVTNNRQFTVSGIAAQADGYFALGTLLGLTGENTGFLRKIRLDVRSVGHGAITLFRPFPNLVAVTDTFTMTPGCDRLPDTCKNKWGNLINNRAYGLFIPGVDALISGPAGLVGQTPQ